MHFSKIATVLFFTAVAVAAPAPEAAPADRLVARTTCPRPNACKKNGKYYPSEPSCPVGDSYRCSTTALIAIANCVQLFNDVNIDVTITDLFDVILYN